MTNKDYLMVFATVIMICDHIGAYFFPEVGAWRAIGRMGFPIWFFFAGYSYTRPARPVIAQGAILLSCAQYVALGRIFPGNALWSVIAGKIVAKNIDRYFWPLVIVLVLTLPLTLKIFQYGGIAILFAIWGAEQAKATNRQRYMLAISFVSFWLMQIVFASFMDTHEKIASSLATLAVCLYLSRYQRRTYADNNLLQWVSKNTLGIYILHLIVFAGLSTALGIYQG